jgi:prepilin-type N-terminal cleavage/methylation domain-containing protein
MRAPTQTTGSARGFTLIEVMVSMTVLAVGVLLMSTLLVRSSRTAGATSAVSYQTAILAAELGRYDAIPFTQLAAGTTCTTSTAAPLAHELCVTITNVSANVRQVKVVVTPTAPTTVAADSVVFDRSISGYPANPLDNTP